MDSEEQKAEIKRMKDGYKEILKDYDKMKKDIQEAKEIGWQQYEKSLKDQETKDKKFSNIFMLIAIPVAILALFVWWTGTKVPSEPQKYEDLPLCIKLQIEGDPDGVWERYCDPNR